MPRFYFDISVDSDLVVDDEGLELRGADDARRAARHALAETAKEAAARGANGCTVMVRDELGKAIYSVSLATAPRQG